MSHVDDLNSRQPKLLMIDDDRGQLTANQMMAKDLGFNVISVFANGYGDTRRFTACADDLSDLDAIIQDHGPINMIMSDFDMPDFNGKDVIEHIRGLDGCDRIPALILSGNDSQQVLDIAQNLRATLLLKPMTKASLGDALGQLSGRLGGGRL